MAQQLRKPNRTYLAQPTLRRRDLRIQWLQILIALAVLGFLIWTRPGTAPAQQSSTRTVQPAPPLTLLFELPFGQ